MQKDSGIVPNPLSKATFLIEQFTIEPALNRVSRNAHITHLEPKAMQLLVFMAERDGEVLSREVLLDSVWGEAFVSDQVLSNAISQIRHAFGEDGKDYIETIPKNGYRLIARVIPGRPELQLVHPSTPSGAAGSPPLDVTRDACSEKVPEVTTANALPLTSPRRFLARHWKPMAAGCVVVVLLLVPALWIARTKKVRDARMTPSVAVLPFEDLSPGKDQEYFSDGMSEELLSSLAKIPELKVTARTSSFQFKGKNLDPRTVGKKLNVSTILEGSVRKEGQRVRVTAQLVKAEDGFHLWSESYDRDLTDIFAVQEEIAHAVAGAMRVKLLGEKSTSPRSTSVEAYDAYLQGRYLYTQVLYNPRTEGGFDKVIAYFELATKLDPGFAPAWTALAGAHYWRSNSEPDLLRREKDIGQARMDVERAMLLDPNLARAYLGMGLIQIGHDWDWAGADASFQRALALEPGNTTVIANAAGLAATLNHFDESLRLARHSVQLDPLRPGAYQALEWNAWWAGRLDEAEAAARKLLELDPNYGSVKFHNLQSRVHLARSRPQEALLEADQETSVGWRLQGLALAYHALGRKQESDHALAELIVKRQGINAFQIAEVYAFRGEIDAAFRWLERAYVQRDFGLIYVKGDPLLKNLERDPRYAAFLRKMRLSE